MSNEPPERFAPLPWQKPYLAAALNPEIKFISACVGRQSGKTYSTVQLVKRKALQARSFKTYRIWWCAPSYPQAEHAFDTFLDICPPGSAEFKRLIKNVRRTDPKRIEFHNGTVIEFKSTDKANNLRGKGVHLLIVDEAAFVPDQVWNQHLLPTLAATDGEAVFISTPEQKNWFYDLWVRGNDSDQPLYASFHGTTLDNLAAPGVARFVEESRRTMPTDVFRREILAEFLEDESDVFRGVKDYVYLGAGLSSLEEFLPELEGVYLGEDHTTQAYYSMGVDVAKLRDWTVISTVKYEQRGDEVTKKLVYLDRFRGEDFAVQKQRLVRAWKRYGQPRITVDASGKGDAFVEEMKRSPNPIPDWAIEPFVFTTWSKKTLIQSLQADLDHGRVCYPRVKVLLDELSAYQYTILPSGEPRYSAPGKRNDDCVISLALACIGARESEEPELVGRYGAALLGF